MNALLQLLRSMRFAIAILAVVAVAATTGSILEQNQPAVTYVSRHGEFWTNFFMLCGLTDVYHAWWFFALLAFMATSTALCLWQNTPAMLRDMRSYRENKSIASLRNLEFHTEMALNEKPATQAGLASYLTTQGFRYKQVRTDGGALLAARAGSMRRLGYLLVHGAMVLICVGGLIDDASSYRASMRIPQGQAASVAQIQDGDAVRQQQLPFSVRLKDFRIAHYNNGQPSDFTSDIEIVDGEHVTPATLQVNHPYTYRGVTLFQSGFDDGGSQVRLGMQALGGGARQTISATVGGNAALLIDGEPATLELSELRALNVFDRERLPEPAWHTRSQPSARTRDIGPSVAFRLRDKQGQAEQWLVYRNPVEVDGLAYRVIGRQASSEPAMRYLRIPADADGGIQAFTRLAQALADPQQRAAAASSVARATDARLAATLEHTTAVLLEGFQRQGYRALVELMPPDSDSNQERKVGQLYLQLLERSAAELLKQDLPPSMLHELLTAYSDAVDMRLQALFTFDDFTQVDATVLQVTHAPGAALVYLGAALLALGVIAMYFVRERRIWLYAAGGKLLLAFSANRNTPALRGEFERHAQAIAQLAAGATPNSMR